MITCPFPYILRGPMCVSLNVDDSRILDTIYLRNRRFSDSYWVPKAFSKVRLSADFDVA